MLSPGANIAHVPPQRNIPRNIRKCICTLWRSIVRVYQRDNGFNELPRKGLKVLRDLDSPFACKLVFCYDNFPHRSSLRFHVFPPYFIINEMAVFANCKL